MSIDRDLLLRNRQRQAQKADVKPRYRAVLCAANGSRDAGSVWADENAKLVYFQFFGSGGVGEARCEKLVPELGLGVYVGKTDDNLAWQVLEDDPLLRRNSTDNRNYQSVAARDLKPGGRLFLWVDSRQIDPLATYPTPNSLSVNVVGGDYPYSGTRKTFAGALDRDLTASVPGTANQHRIVGLYLDSANALQTVDGTAVSTAIDPPEPTWPAGAFRLSVVRLRNAQTQIIFTLKNDSTNDVFDRRMLWSDESGGGGGWPFDNVLTVSATDPDADHATIADAIAAASAGDVILLDNETFSGTSTITVNKAISIVSLGRAIVRKTSNSDAVFSITAAGARLIGLSIEHTGAGTTITGITWNVDNVLLQDLTVTLTGAATTSRGLDAAGGNTLGAKVINTFVTVSGASVNYAVNDTSASISMGIYGGSLSGTTLAINGTQAGSTLKLIHPVLASGTIAYSGTISGEYLDSSGNLIAAGASIFTHAKGVVAYRSTAQTLSDSTPTAIDLDSETRDDAGFHSTSSNTSRLTVPTGHAGWYIIAAGIGYASSSTGVRDCQIRLNGNIIGLNRVLPATGGNDSFFSAPKLYYLAAADYIEMYGYQTSSGNLDTVGGSPYTWLSMVRIG